MIWRNGEGYYDPTAGEALSRIQKEERRKRKQQSTETHKQYRKQENQNENTADEKQYPQRNVQQ